MSVLLRPPADTPEYAYPAWVSALVAATRNPEILAAFQQDTGCTYIVPRTSIDRLIDDAAGVTDQLGRAFVEWFNANVWGQVECLKPLTSAPAAHTLAPQGKP
jgi:hypothetical protein